MDLKIQVLGDYESNYCLGAYVSERVREFELVKPSRCSPHHNPYSLARLDWYSNETKW
jgi:hypothetical protein